jgi:hypothetical protein
VENDPDRRGGLSVLLRRFAAVLLTTAFASVAFTAPDGARAAPPPAGIVEVHCADSVQDATTLDDAIAASQPGDEIFISGLAGTCKLVEPVTLLGDRSYVGASESGVTLLADRAGMPYVLASAATGRRVGDPFTLRDLTIDCAGRSAVGLLVRSWHVDVENTAVESCASAGVDDMTPPATSTSVNSTFRGLVLQRCGYGFESGAGVTDGYLVDSWVVGATRAGIEVEDAAGWEIEGNHVYDYSRSYPVAGDAIDVRMMYATTVADNYVEDFGGGRSPADGIHTSAQNGWGSVISGNKVFSRRGDRAGEFISVWGLSGSAHVVVTGNEVMGSGAGTGLAYHRNGNRLLVTSTGNQVAGVASPRFASAGTLTGGY